ncbi:hypothetical protein DV736_g1948, partial [Chaetothyriales sp. CBS 134916]
MSLSFGSSTSKKHKKIKKQSAFDVIDWDFSPSVEDQPLVWREAPSSDPKCDDSVYDLLRFKFPISSIEHGSEIVTISVGGAKEEFIPKQTFNIHKMLLIRASEFFSQSLQQNFVEGKINHIDLDWACPAVFEVLYQALYTGRVFHAAFYTHNYNHTHNGGNGNAIIPQDVLWLRTFNLAHFTMFRDLLLVAYERIRQLFNSDDHCKEWKKILSQDLRFATAVACRLAELHSHLYEGSKEHPTNDGAL